MASFFSKDQLERISAAYAELSRVHPEFEEKIRQSGHDLSAKSASLRPMVVEAAPGASDAQAQRIVRELVALSEGRPALLISGGDYPRDKLDSIPDVLRHPLRDNGDLIRNAISGVGRIEVTNHPERSWIGTGFVVGGKDGQDIVVTNQHVATEIAHKRDGTFQFAMGLDRKNKVGAFLDLKEEAESIADDPTATIRIAEVLHIEDAGDELPDLAFLLLEKPVNGGPSYSKLRFATGAPAAGMIPVAAIGYPAKDTRETDIKIVLQLLGDVYNRKRLAPGLIKEVTQWGLTHDCSTLGGNSGSPLVNLLTGEIAGLHFGGTFPNPMNLAVPASVVAARLDEVLRPKRRPETTPAPIPTPTPVSPVNSPSDTQTNTITTAMTAAGHTLSVEIPLRITVEIGAARTLADTRPPAVVDAPTSSIGDAVAKIQAQFGTRPGIVRVRRGLPLVNGEFEPGDAVIVVVDHTVPGAAETISALPRGEGTYRVEARAVSPADLAEAAGLGAEAAAAARLVAEAVARIRYQKPEHLSLDEVDEQMYAVFHASPDAGWPELKDFLGRTRNSLTVAMYNITATHVEEALHEAVSPNNRSLALVLGDASLDDNETTTFERRLTSRFQEDLGRRFTFELADGQRRLFAGHYHTKVAVRDREAFWLSSGNWEDSNQPDLSPAASGETSWTPLSEHNREWHAIILNQKLAGTFEDYIKYDLESYRNLRLLNEAPPVEVAPPRFLVPVSDLVQEAPGRNPIYFTPLRVNKRLRIQPLMTPDNFLDGIIPVIEAARVSIDLQNQSLKWALQNVGPKFEHLMQTLLEKQQAGIPVRIILRNDFDPAMKEKLVDRGFRSARIRMQSKCHTKGIVVDSKVVVIGSHNLTEHGAMANRDASLIVHDEEVASYFGTIFEFDWSRASARVRETPPGVRIYRQGDPIPAGYEVISMAGGA